MNSIFTNRTLHGHVFNIPQDRYRCFPDGVLDRKEKNNDQKLLVWIFGAERRKKYQKGIQKGFAEPPIELAGSRDPAVYFFFLYITRNGLAAARLSTAEEQGWSFLKAVDSLRLLDRAVDASIIRNFSESSLFFLEHPRVPDLV